MDSLVLKKEKDLYLINLEFQIVPANLELKNGTKQILDEQGADGLVQWVKNQKQVLLTDTTFRDAHQSLLATRVRTNDFKQIAEPTARIITGFILS